VSEASETPLTDALFAPLWLRETAPSDEELHIINKSHSNLERTLAEARTALEDIKDHDGGNRYNYREITQLADQALARIDGNDPAQARRPADGNQTDG
jgi:hypothetical protein